MIRPFGFALAAAGACWRPGVAEVETAAAPAPSKLELNRLEAREAGGCRVWLVLDNAGR